MYDQLAKKIPDKIRSERLMVPADPIFNAIAVSSNKHMQLLFAIYTEFIFPHNDELDIDCPKCLGRILHSYNEMRPHLEKLEEEYRLLKLIK